MTNVSYSGDKGGVQKSLYVIDTNGEYKGILKTSATTTEYFNAGGISFAAGASLDPFKSATIFTDFAKVSTFSSLNLSKFSSAFGQKSSKSVFTSAAVTGDNKSVSFMLDPRASHRIILNNQSGSTPFCKSLATGISHMDEIVFTEAGSGKTLQAFFMGFGKGVTLGSTQDIVVGYVGTTGSGGITSFAGLTGGLGNTLVAKNVKTGGTSGVNSITKIIDFRELGDRVINEAASSIFTGTSFGVTFGPNSSSLRTALIDRDADDNKGRVRRTLQNLVFRSDTIAKNHTCFTNDSRFVKQIFIRELNDQSKMPLSTTYLGGMTIDGVSGGTNGTSELDHLIAAYDHKIREDQSLVNNILRQFGTIHTIREVVNTTF